MSAGLFGLFDDVAALAKLAAASIDDVGAAAGKAGTKAVGVVVDDTAVTPRYVEGVAANRELPMIWKITRGSLRNKLFIILPAILLMSQYLPWLLMPLLMVGGAYLSYEGAEKLWEHFGHHDSGHDQPAVEKGPDSEASVVKSAVRTDFILSSEIMVISLTEVADQPFVQRAIVLVVVAFVITALVYGVVALIVKMDDVGLLLAQRESEAARRFGSGLVNAMPKVLSALSTIGIAAMLWVGGHIILLGLDSLGLHAPYAFVHHAEEWAHDLLPAIGGFLGWLVNTALSALVGLVVGAVIVAIVVAGSRARKRDEVAH